MIRTLSMILRHQLEVPQVIGSLDSVIAKTDNADSQNLFGRICLTDSLEEYL